MLVSLFDDQDPESITPAVQEVCAELQAAAGPAERVAGPSEQAADWLALAHYLRSVLGPLLFAEQGPAVKQKALSLVESTAPLVVLAFV